MSYRPSPLAFLARSGVKLVPSGSNRYRCACPVHRGTNPSMGLIRAESGTWLANCFACGFGGDALALVMAIRGCTFPEALRELDCKPTIDDQAPVKMHRRPGIVASCDAPGCGNTIECEGGSYKVPGRGGQVWTTTATDEAFFRSALAGWEMGADKVI